MELKAMIKDFLFRQLSMRLEILIDVEETEERISSVKVQIAIDLGEPYDLYQMNCCIYIWSCII